MGCMGCKAVCPVNAISVQDEIKAFNAYINITKCISCKRCKNVCPNIKDAIYRRPIEWKQGWAEENIRKFSSSGGAASAIMREFLLSGGAVAACKFKNGKFIYELTNNPQDINEFCGSKYVKSNPIGSI